MCIRDRCEAAETLREVVNGDTVSYVVNRNINYTNVCYFGCGFCAFSKGKHSETLRGPSYDIELEESEEHERSLDRDTRGLAYALAARHGDVKVLKMLEELDPAFSMLHGCNLDEPLYRDVANFVVRHAVPKEALAQPTSGQPVTEVLEPAYTNIPLDSFSPRTSPEEHVNGADNSSI